jgi:hypothetical protein
MCVHADESKRAKSYIPRAMLISEQYMKEKATPTQPNLEEYFKERIAQNLGVEASSLTPEMIHDFEQKLEFNLRPSVESLPTLKILTHHEILERRKRVQALVDNEAMES